MSDIEKECECLCHRVRGATPHAEGDCRCHMPPQTLKEEIVNDFRNRFSTGSTDENGVFTPDAESARRESFLSSTIDRTLERVREAIEKDSDLRMTKADSPEERSFDFGYDVKKKEILSALEEMGKEH